MKIHHEGYGIIASFAVLIIGVNLLVFYLSKDSLLPKIISLAITIPFFALVVWFFRVPDRPVVENQNTIYAPADGKIVVIEKTFEPEYFNDERIQVSIFMSPLNVHCNYYPIEGKIAYTKYHPGKYLVAWHPKSSTLNERSTVVIKDEKGREILVRQIAGAVARRIVPYSEEGMDIEQGQELGFIKFGSRVDLFLPLDTKIKVNIDDKTVAKRTIIGTLK